VLAVARDRPELLEPIAGGLPYLGAEVLYAAREEMAVHLGDVLSRRTRASIQDARASVAAAAAAAGIMAGELGWDAKRTAAEVARFVDEVTADLETAGLEVASDAARGDAR
jgi:glycerol-3-phosphate dehydrogenase